MTTASASRRARSPSPARGRIRERGREELLDPGEPLGRERERAAARGRGRRRRRRAARSRRGRPRAALDARRHVRQVAGQPEQLELERERERVELRAGRAAASASSSSVEEARERVNARAFASGSPKSRSIASAADQPDAEPIGALARLRGASATSSTPVTVCSSPEPSWSTSSTCESGSSRAPKRDFVFLTPFAIAPIRPRSRV